jgi:hypothetical protein
MENIPFFRRGRQMGQIPSASADIEQKVAEQVYRPVTGYTSQITVTDKSEVLLPANPDRKFLFIQNNDPIAFANMSFGVAATLTTGMRLGSSGGGILLDNNVPTAAIFIIGSSPNNSNVTLISG